VPIKTLHLTNAWHPTSGGIRTFYLAMLARANEAGRPMRLVVPGERTHVEDIGRWGRIYHVRAPRALAVDRRYRMLLPQTFLMPGAPLRRILSEEQPALVEVCDKYALSYVGGMLRRLGVVGLPRPTLVGLSCERMDDNLEAVMRPGSLIRRLASWYMARIYAPQFDYHLANSQYTAREILGGVNKRHPRDVFVVPMGVDVDGFRPDRRSIAMRQAWASASGVSPDDSFLLYAGRLSPEKHLTTLVDMMGNLPDECTRRVRLVIAGDGPSVEMLRALADRTAPGRVVFWGHVSSRDELAELYASADIFVHPNPREPFGIGPLEAMASGVPLIVPSHGGVLSYASPDNAWLAAPDGEAFASAVRLVMACRAERERRARAALVTARTFAWARVAPRIFDLYDALHARRQTVDRARWSLQPLLA
jgi:alpha-1,6-mannosyltransferase